MTRIRFDPAVPLDVEVSFDSPQVASCVLWQRAPGGEWRMFAKLTDEDVVARTEHRYRLEPLPDGGEIRYRFLFLGNPQTALAARLAFAQDGLMLPAEVAVTGSTDADGVAVRRGEVSFHAA